MSREKDLPLAPLPPRPRPLTSSSWPVVVAGVVVVAVVVVVEPASVVTDSAPLLTLLVNGGDGLSNLTDLVLLVIVLGIAPKLEPSSLFALIGGNSGQLSLSSLDNSSASSLLSSLNSSILLRKISNFSCVFLFSLSNASILFDWFIIILSIADSNCSILVLRSAVFRVGILFPLSVPSPFIGIFPRWELRGRLGGE